MPDYKITQVSSQPPREWGEGTKHTYYIRTMLEGHPRPVEIGKKKLGTLSPGMTVTGTIIPKPDFEADGWKADTFGGGFSGGGSKPAYQPRDDDAIRAQWAINAALQEYAVLKPAPASFDTDGFMEKRARFYFNLVNTVKGGETPDPKAQTNPTTSQSAFKDNDAEAASLYQSIASSEGLDEFGQPEINPQDIPF